MVLWKMEHMNFLINIEISMEPNWHDLIYMKMTIVPKKGGRVIDQTLPMLTSSTKDEMITFIKMMAKYLTKENHV